MKEHFRNSIKQQIIGYICFVGQACIEDVVNNVTGLYPLELSDILKELEADCTIVRNPDSSYALHNRSKVSPNQYMTKTWWTYHLRRIQYENYKLAANLPAPHPTRHEWRFDTESVCKLADIILKDSSYKKSRMVILGAPSVGVVCWQAKLAEKMVIFDINKHLLEMLKDGVDSGDIELLAHDLNAELPHKYKGKFSVAVMDPPWYVDDYLLFIERAIELLEPFGRMYISLFPPSTRPSAAHDIHRIVEFCSKNHLSVLSLNPGFFGYIIPQFESNTFKQEGVDILSRGDYGSLLVLTKLPKEKQIAETHIDERWESIHYSLGDRSVEICVKILERSDFGSIEIEPLDRNKRFLISTSRRYSERKRIGIWLSDNRAFHVKGISLFCAICEGIARRDSKVAIYSALVKINALEERVFEQEYQKVEEFMKSIFQ